MKEKKSIRRWGNCEARSSHCGHGRRSRRSGQRAIRRDRNASSGRVTWREVGQGYFELPELYATAVRRVSRALQVRIQELILKDAILDQDQPVPETIPKARGRIPADAVGGLEKLR